MKRAVDEIMQYAAKVYNLSEAQSECLSFGMQAALEIGINVILSVIVLEMMNMLWEGTFFFCLFIPLRTYSGGYHSDSYLKCLIFSILTMCGVMLSSKMIRLSSLTLLIIIIAESLSTGLLAPVITAERPVSKREYQKFSKKLRVLLVGIVLLSVCLVVMNLNKMLNIVCMCLLLILISLILGKIKYKQYQVAA